MNVQKVGALIAALRHEQGLTQTELGERLHVSFQAVSKWERGETLPDTMLLPDLASILGTSVDFLLSGGEAVLHYRGKIRVSDMREGLDCLRRMGELLGRENLLYRAAIDGVNSRLNVDIEESFADERTFEAFLAEAIIQNLMAGAYVDLTDVKNSFKFEHFRKIVLDYAGRYQIK